MAEQKSTLQELADDINLMPEYVFNEIYLPPIEKKPKQEEYKLTQEELEDLEQRIKAEKAGFESYMKGIRQMEAVERANAASMTEEELIKLLTGEE